MSQYMKLLSDPILIMAIFFMIKRIMSFHLKVESVQYNAYLAETGAMRGTSKEKLYQEIGLKSLQLGHWRRKLGMFYKTCKSKKSTISF